MNTTQKVIITGAAALILLRLLDMKKTAQKLPSGPTLDELFILHGNEFNVEPGLLKAIARKESNFDIGAVHDNANGSTDYGVMQVNDSTFEHYGIEHVSLNLSTNVTSDNFLDPDTNIRTAANLLSDIRNELGDKFSTWTWISAYNIGSPNVIKNGITNPGYVGEVYLYYTLYKVL